MEVTAKNIENHRQAYLWWMICVEVIRFFQFFLLNFLFIISLFSPIHVNCFFDIIILRWWFISKQVFYGNSSKKRSKFSNHCCTQLQFQSKIEFIFSHPFVSMINKLWNHSKHLLPSWELTTEEKIQMKMNYANWTKYTQQNWNIRDIFWTQPLNNILRPFRLFANRAGPNIKENFKLIISCGKWYQHRVINKSYLPQTMLLLLERL